MTWIDSHCHLTSDALYEQVDAVIERGLAAGIERFVTIATDLEDAAKADALAKAHGCVEIVTGIHPHEAEKVSDGWDDSLIEWAKRDHVRAVGEMGLDYHYDFADRAIQQRVFTRQLEIATVVQKPVVIHCREAFEDCLAILSKFPDLQGVVFHCFTGTYAEAAALWDSGYWISFTGVITFKKSDALREIVKQCHPERMMIETDSPYLSPEPKRNIRPNEPAHLCYIGECVAKVRGESNQACADRLNENTRRFFDLPRDN